MILGKHKKTEEGTFRKERSDSLVKNLAKEYTVLKKFDPRTKLGTLRERYGVESLDQLLKVLKKK